MAALNPYSDRMTKHSFPKRRISAASELSIRRLHTKLIAMMSFSLRVVDYTAKACASGRIEVALHSVREPKQLAYLRESVFALIHELRESGQHDENLTGLSEAALTISANLSFVCDRASEVSLQVATLVSEGRRQQRGDILLLSQCISRSLRLCTVAFANREMAHAQSALRLIDDYGWRCPGAWELRAITPRGTVGHRREESIARDLKGMRENVRAIASQLTNGAMRYA